MRYLVWILRLAISLLLAAFFGFVGWYKAFATLEELARHHAFTVHLPVLLGKLTGWMEMACALTLIAGSLWFPARRAQALAALLLIAEQIVSSIIHWRVGEIAMIGQNAVIVALLAVLVVLARKPAAFPAGSGD